MFLTTAIDFAQTYHNSQHDIRISRPKCVEIVIGEKILYRTAA